jgi:hypothetical protein
MAKPNYSFAKRQRDLAKEQKKEEKLQRKKRWLKTALNPDGEVALQMMMMLMHRKTRRRTPESDC